MEYKTIRQFTAERGVSYEAGRRLVSKYRQQLADHVIRKNGTMLLDEAACQFLDERRKASPVVVRIEGSSSRVAELEEELQTLQKQYNLLNSKLVASQERIIALMDENKTLTDATGRYNTLLEDKERIEADRDRMEQERNQAREALEESQREAETARETAEEARREAEEAQKEAESFKPSLFGFYRKRK